ncbi:hypothetical protein HN51_065466 [Arachis hypogaea]|uniref:Pectinesterase inhibitor domain-containing protein n=1 Tax=Arachis hypogaea TaxID=3818 RepID=A0A444ZEN4_ARAHY|nr:pectinesterase inhibitor-like [Arachis ipaensis]XP_025647300.1 pectinesterase inhibitor-like [Arachis hypogaea]QHO06613.1 Cell wall / vacuolar inhibitor of fructosidase [Arachis hypogaea]RYR12645.1 hypothetical protein Ahy_B04g070087 [Arachis hypogaea]
MKLSTFSTIIALHFAISCLFLIQPIQSTIPKPGLLETVCRETPHHYLCVFILKSHLQPLQLRSGVDVAGFARIALEVVAANASATIDRIKEIQKQSEDKKLKSSLESCIVSYTKIVNVLLPQALKCMDKGDYSCANRNAFIAGTLAGSCEKKCKESSSAVMTDTNIYMQNICSIAVSIITKMPQSVHQTLA